MNSIKIHITCAQLYNDCSIRVNQLYLQQLSINAEYHCKCILYISCCAGIMLNALLAHYSQNYAGIVNRSLVKVKHTPAKNSTLHYLKSTAKYYSCS